MADKSLFSRLQKLFSTQVVVRRVGKGKTRAIDTQRLQSQGNIKATSYYDRFGRLHSSRQNWETYNNQYNYSSNRLELYTDYEAMDKDSIIASVLDIYSDECLGPDTLIPLLNGKKYTIKELYENDVRNFSVYGLSNNGNFTPSLAEKVIYKGKKQTYILTLDDGTKITATDNHIFVKSDNSQIELKDLKVGDDLLVLHTNNHKIISIEAGEITDVYDIVNVGDNHLFAIETNDGGKCYVHNCTLKNDIGDVLRINSDDENIKKILQNLFYDVLNIEFNLWAWIRGMNKYGDYYLNLDIEEGIGIVNVSPISAYEIEREEGFNSDNPYEVRFKMTTMGGGATGFNYQKSSNDIQNYIPFYKIAHFRLFSDTNFLPYGRSLLEPARKTWKQLTLMEDAMLIHRIMRAPEKRVFKIDVGNIPPNEVDQHVRNIIDQMKKVPYVDEATGDYNLKFNIQNMLEDYYLPVRGGQSGTQIDTLGGMEFTGIDDINYLKNRMMAALKVPKAFIGYEEGVEGKATLAQQDIRFARSIERVQKIVLSELTKIAIIHLYAQGYENEALSNFYLELTPPSIIYQQEKVALWIENVRLASDIKTSKLLSQEWVYKNIFNMSDDEWKAEQVKVINDLKLGFRQSQIENEGNDPIKTGESFGTPHDLAALSQQSAEAGGGGQPAPGDNEGGSPPGGFEGAGRPEEGSIAGTDDSSFGRNAMGYETDIKPEKAYHTFKKSPISVEGMQLKTSLQNSKIKTKKMIAESLSADIDEKTQKFDMLDERNILNNDV